MFSSNNNNNNNNSYPLYYNQSPSIYTNRAIPENNNIFLQHYYGKFLPPTSYPPISDNSIVNFSSEPSINQQNGLLCPSNVRVSSSRRAAGKKDRHTKITTAQGVRDRRVRLSMSIAREFFNLQDMLGFDKASKTLGWLLNKSKAAIDELASTSNFKSPVTPLDDEVDVTSEEDQQQQKEFCTSKNNEKSSSKKRKRREKNNNTRNVVNELRRREEARERARERTRKKKIVNDHHQKHLESSSNLVICQLNPEISNGGISKEGGSSSTVRESVVIKGNYSNKSNNNYNYEMISSKDEQDNCNYYNDYFNKSASESCNYYSGILQPNGFPALNIINLSTEIHINARPWDTCSNHILH